MSSESDLGWHISLYYKLWVDSLLFSEEAPLCPHCWSQLLFVCSHLPYRSPAQLPLGFSAAMTIKAYADRS